ncbi:metalloregulator ArsR/SmtB family transcription factor [Halalkalibacter sp. APA_J-10(15)]|uniref:helix-turn-helix transcriptional regulator n=1 Tax=Halalkalibacter sp. APA_J-10(15) TaxID=2933805 RepID=UPI001FF13CED|nr:metalloregulator ArsR/SmtB family transcription factor [Halalkalibacter sp. APA_J-10(15)]MCK0470933.1 transcriptional regulator [Halalkalibacter sp. APA_J-10(15)]
MHSTKNKLLELLKKNGTLSVQNLTATLNITHMAVRKHILSLEKDGLIEGKEVRQAVGRPQQRYSLTSKGELLFPRNYEGISVEFLQDIEELHGYEVIHTLFKKREQRLTKSYKQRLIQTNFDEKIAELTNIQNEKGYMAELQKINDGTYELTEYNCPILAIASDYKDACTCETEMFKQVLETNEIDRISCQSDGEPHCKFLIRKNK